MISSFLNVQQHPDQSPLLILSTRNEGIVHYLHLLIYHQNHSTPFVMTMNQTSLWTLQCLRRIRCIAMTTSCRITSSHRSPLNCTSTKCSMRPTETDPAHHYYNTRIQYLHFTFDEKDAMTRSRDSAIFEESYHPNYIQTHPLYSKILIKKNMTPRNSLPTKETIV